MSGQGGIRTHETREGPPVFKTGAFNRSATCPLSDRRAGRTNQGTKGGMLRSEAPRQRSTGARTTSAPNQGLMTGTFGPLSPIPGIGVSAGTPPKRSLSRVAMATRSVSLITESAAAFRPVRSNPSESTTPVAT